MKEFGSGDSSIDFGYNLELLVSHFESLVGTEGENLGHRPTKRKSKRLELAEDCLDKLYQILEF